MPPAAARTGAKDPLVEAVGNVRTGNAAAYGKAFFATAVNPEASTMFKLDWVLGNDRTIAGLGAHGAFVDKDYAKRHRLRAGSPVTLTFAGGERATYRVEGVFDPPAGGSPFGRVTISQAQWDAHNE